MNTQIFSDVNWISDQKFSSSKTDNINVWQIAEVQEGKIKLDTYFDQIDFSFGYIKFIIHSDEEKSYLASLRPDNYAQVYLNEKLALTGSPFNPVLSDPYLFLLNLKKGKNNVLMKVANYFGSWYIDFKISDPQKKLIFKIDKK